MYCAFSDVLLFASSNECITFSMAIAMQDTFHAVSWFGGSFFFNSSVFIFVVYDSSTPSQTMAQATWAGLQGISSRS